jgi:hemin uptake protein HemP
MSSKPPPSEMTPTRRPTSAGSAASNSGLHGVPSRAYAPDVVIASTALFSGHRRICIDHAGVMYRLQITSANKLILTK